MKRTTRTKSTTTEAEATPTTTTVAVVEDTNAVELESQIQELTNQLNAERAKTQQFGRVLGQMRYSTPWDIRQTTLTFAMLMVEMH